MKNNVVKIESDGGFTLPPEILEKLGISVGDDVEFEIKDGKLFLTKIEIDTHK